MLVEIVTIGDELLLGETIDINAVWLARELGNLGISVVRRTTVGDGAGAISDAVLEALHRTGAVITTGGLKVAPRPVEDALTTYVPGVAEAVVVGVPDPEWGQAVAAAVVPTDPGHPPTVAVVRESLRGILPAHALPRRLLVVDALPLRGPGKPDRSVVTDLLVSAGPSRDTMEA